MKQVQTETERFHDLLRSFDTAVLVTHGREFHFHARPMVIAQVEENCDLWFITDEDSAKVHEIKADTRVQVICQNGRASCVSIAGRASLNRDRQKIEQLWKSAHRVWFPEGVDDPRILLIHVAGEHGEYWDNSGLNGLRYIYESVRAAVRGVTPEIREGRQHGHVHLPGA